MTNANSLVTILREAALVWARNNEDSASAHTGMRDLDRVGQAASDVLGELFEEQEHNAAAIAALVTITDLCESLLLALEQGGTDSDGATTLELADALRPVVGMFW